MRIAVPVIALALVLTVALGVIVPSAQTQPGAVSGSAVPVHLYWSASCPHCAKAKAFLDGLARGDPGVDLRAHELSNDARVERAYIALARHFDIHPPVVPLILVGGEVLVGYESDETTGTRIVAAIAACRAERCIDVADVVVRQLDAGGGMAGAGGRVRSLHAQLPRTVSLPLVGDVHLQSLSLPVLTMVLGAVDGFNPCAMWVLLFLIGLLLGMRDPLRMWSYGAVFLLTSAAVYFAFMAAWLNLFLVLGSLAWIRMGIGIFAVVGGAYYLWQFVNNPDALCPVTSVGQRQSVMTRLRQAVSERSFLLAVLGIAALAVAVNMVELLCSAGIPAIFTQVLALSDLSPSAYYGYLTLYIAAFLVDDAIVFVTAMVTLRASGLAANYARYSHLIGGVVMGAIGLMLLFRPNWLAFA